MKSDNKFSNCCIISTYYQPIKISVMTTISFPHEICDIIHSSSSKMSDLHENELNRVLCHYLKQSGFIHAAFCLKEEANLEKSQIESDSVLDGALVSLVSEGLQYKQMKANNILAEAWDDFVTLEPIDLITKDISELQTFVEDKKQEVKQKDLGKEVKPRSHSAKRKARKKKGKKTLNDQDENMDTHQETHGSHQTEGTEISDGKALCLKEEADLQNSQTESESVLDGALVSLVSEELQNKEMKANNVEPDAEDDLVFREPVDLITKNIPELRKTVDYKEQDARQKDLKARKDKGKQVLSGDDENMNIHKETQGSRHTEGTEISGVIPPSDVTILDGQGYQVYSCSWSPSGCSLASGLHNSIAHIWTIFDETGKPILDSGKPSHTSDLQHKHDTPDNVVASLDWNEDGTLLGTGSYDGKVRIWNLFGDLEHIFFEHIGPVKILKWKKNTDLILTGSIEGIANVWSFSELKLVQQNLHPVDLLDVDWLDDLSFATCSTDRKIRIWIIGETKPVKIISGHKAMVNYVKSDPTGSLLASCSLDRTVKIWNIKLDRGQCMHDFGDQEADINAIQWSPIGPGTDNSYQPLVLASASADSTVKLWDVEQGKLRFSLSGHRESVCTIDFSPNGDYLASGSEDGVVYIWSVKEGKVIKSYTGEKRVGDIRWNKYGNKLAAVFHNTVCVLDVRM